ncbi:MAG: twin-arginine translocase TatA/TatE family subunit [Armatimonadetes bacterium]|nr:twin-arginine translocase TatA/TatE family subunit [Armatimonadota bacterium]
MNLNTLAFLNSPMDWGIILIVVLVLFGGKKIPELMRGVGQGVGELQKGLDEAKKGIMTPTEEQKTAIDQKAP